MAELELEEKVLEHWEKLHEAIRTRSHTLTNEVYRKLHEAGPWEKYYTLKVMKTLDNESYFDTVYLCTEDVKIAERGKLLSKVVVNDILDYWEASTSEFATDRREFDNLGQIEEYKEMYKSFKHSLIKDSI